MDILKAQVIQDFEESLIKALKGDIEVERQGLRRWLWRGFWWKMQAQWQEFKMAVIVWAIGRVHEIKPDHNYAIVFKKRPAHGEVAALESALSHRSKDFGKGWFIWGPNIEIKELGIAEIDDATSLKE